MPGDEVHVGMGLSDSSLAGNEIEETSSDFTFEDDDEPLMVKEEEDQLQPARQKPKRRQSQRKPLSVVPVVLKYQSLQRVLGLWCRI